MLEHWLKDTKNKQYLRLSVAPKEVIVTYGRKIESVNIVYGSDFNIYAGKKLDTITLSSFFPKNDYPFIISNETKKTKPYDVIDIIKKWIKDKKVLTYTILKTKVNKYVIIEDISYSEKDGSGDVYFTIILREYRYLKENKASSDNTTTNNNSGGKIRPTSNVTSVNKNYTVKKGDTLCAISLKFYGNSKDYIKIFNANKGLIKNPNFILVGWVLKIP